MHNYMKLRRIFHYLASAAIVLFWLVVIACAWSNHISPLYSVVAPMAYMAFPYLMVLGIVLVLLTLFWSKKLALTGVVLMACCLPRALSVCPLHFSRTVIDESVSTDTFSVMTFNAFHFNSYKDISRDSIAADEAAIAIIDADPDIVLIQESFGFDPFEIRRKKISPALSAQIRAYYPYRLFTSDAMGVVSKYPFKTIDLPNYNPNGDESFRVQRVEFQIGDSLVNVYSIHLQSLFFSPAELGIIARIAGGNAKHIKEVRGSIMNKIRYAFRSRARQAQSVRNLVDSLSAGPVIVCGDFNDVPDCWAMREIKGNNLTDAFAASGFGPAVTYRKHNLYFRIDHILCSKQLKPLGAQVLKVGESDHYPLFALFAFRGKK